MRVFFGTSDEFEVGALESVYEAALGVTSEARTPYEAAALLETWFREAGGFTYDEQPPAPIGGTPALIDFVNETKRGYCQHYAGAMALMLRLLGVPARVAVGFTSGEYSSDDKEWVVKDTNAHAWVEVGSPSSDPLRPDPGPRRARRHVRGLLPEFNAGDAAGIGFADRLENISPTRAQQIRSAANRPGLEDAALGGGTSGALTVVRERGLGIFTLLALVIGGGIAAARAEGDQEKRQVRHARPARARLGVPADIVASSPTRASTSRRARRCRRSARSCSAYSIDATLRPRRDRRPLRAAGPQRGGAPPRPARPPRRPQVSCRAARSGEPRPRRRQPPLALDLSPGTLGRPCRLPYGEKQA